MKPILNVAISTDTILYAPFFLAYFGNDFEDTPFGPVDVRIIGLGDERFNEDKKLRGDGFVVLSLLFGYSDIGIGDPSVLIDLDKDPEKYYDAIKNFYISLNKSERESLSGKHPDLFSSQPKKQKLIEILKTKNLKIVGSLVSKVAFVVVGKTDFKPNPYIDPPHYIGGIHSTKPLQPHALGTNKIICYPDPSTGFCIGMIIRNEILSKSGRGQHTDIDYKDFGEELIDIKDNEISITCDFVSVTNRLKKKEIILLDDFIDANHNVTFTAIMAANGDSAKQNRIKAFLYAVDKNLHEINQFLDIGDKYGMKSYFRERLEKHKANKKLLIADRAAEKETQAEIAELIDTFIDQLFKWKRCQSADLFYTEVKPHPKDLLEMYNIRLKSRSESPIKDEGKVQKYISNLWTGWYKIQTKVSKKKNKWWWRLLIRDEKNLFYISTFIAVVGVVGTVISFFDWKIPIKFNGFFGFIGLVILFTVGYLVRCVYLQKFERFVYRNQK